MHLRAKIKCFDSAGLIVAICTLLLFLTAPLAAQDTDNLIPLSDLEALSVSPGPQAHYAAIAKALEMDGYQILDVRRTLLNRAMIHASNEDHLREIVVSRSSGQVLRDVIIEEFGVPSPSPNPSIVPLEEIIGNSEDGIRVLPR